MFPACWHAQCSNMYACMSQYVCLATLMLILVGSDDNRRQLIHYRLSLSCTTVIEYIIKISLYNSTVHVPCMYAKF